LINNTGILLWKKTIFIPIIFLLLSFNIVNAAVFSMSPLSIGISQVSPPVVFQNTHSTASVILGANQTSANVSVILTEEEQSLITNPDFYNGADGWYVRGDLDQLGVYWYNDTEHGSSGGVALFANRTDVGNIVDAVVDLYQNFTVPENVSSENVYIRYWLASTPYIYYTYIRVGIYDWSTNQSSVVYSTRLTGSTSSYQTATGTGSMSLVTGKTYAFVVEVELQQYWYIYDQSFYLSIDAANLTYTPTIYRYNDNILGVDSDSNVTSRLVLTSSTCTAPMNLTIVLSNTTVSANISIVKGSPQITASKWIVIPAKSSSVYYSGIVSIHIESETNGTCTVNSKLEYTLGGVSVSYPFMVNATISG